MRAISLNLFTKLRVTFGLLLATCLVLLNVVRPFAVAYRHTADVIASENRFQVLHHSNTGKRLGFLVRVNPTNVLMLERPYQASVSATVPNLQVRNVEVICQHRLTPEVLSNQVDAMSQVIIPRTSRSLSKESRLNRWMITVLEHQIDRHEWSDSEPQLQSAEASTEPASDSSASPYRLVSMKSEPSKSEVLEKLRQELSERKANDARMLQEQEQTHASRHGVITLASSWATQPFVIRSDANMMFMCVIIATFFTLLCSQGHLVLAKLALVRRNTFEKAMRRLQIDVLNNLGNVSIHSAAPLEKSHPLITQFQSIVVRSGDWIIFLSLAICCARLVLDEAWRQLLWQSPVAAISASWFGIG